MALRHQHAVASTFPIGIESACSFAQSRVWPFNSLLIGSHLTLSTFPACAGQISAHGPVEASPPCTGVWSRVDGRGDAGSYLARVSSSLRPRFRHDGRYFACDKRLMDDGQSPTTSSRALAPIGRWLRVTVGGCAPVARRNLQQPRASSIRQAGVARTHLCHQRPKALAPQGRGWVWPMSGVGGG